MMKLSTQLTGIAGEYYVAAEFSRRGYIAAITLRNTDGVDMLINGLRSNKPYLIQVKTTKGKHKWPLSSKVEKEISNDKFYVFVHLPSDIQKKPDYRIVRADILGKEIAKQYKRWLAKPGKNGEPHKKTNFRQFDPK